MDPDVKFTCKGVGPDTGEPEKMATGAGSTGSVVSPPPPPPPPQLISTINDNDKSFFNISDKSTINLMTLP